MYLFFPAVSNTWDGVEPFQAPAEVCARKTTHPKFGDGDDHSLCHLKVLQSPEVHANPLQSTMRSIRIHGKSIKIHGKSIKIHEKSNQIHQNPISISHSTFCFRQPWCFTAPRRCRNVCRHPPSNGSCSWTAASLWRPGPSQLRSRDRRTKQ